MKKNQEETKNRKIYIINFFLIIIITFLVVLYLVKSEDWEKANIIISEVSYKWIIAGLISLLLMWICETFNIYLPIKRIYKKQTFGNAFKICMIGQLFNNLTPFASGGQFMQAYIMTKEGKKTSDVFSALTIKFVINQIVMVSFTILVVISQFRFFADFLKRYLWIAIIGIIINIGIAVLFFICGKHKKVVMNIAKPIINIGSKIHIGKFKFVKDKEKVINKFEKSVENFNEKFELMNSQKKLVAQMSIFALFQSIFYYAITYTIYRAFGNSGNSFLQIIAIQAILMLIMAITPTPGAGLGAEGGFLLLFKKIFKNGSLNLSVFFWRIYVFYIPIIVGALFLINWKKILKK